MISEKTLDVVFCKNCHRLEPVTDDYYCANCGMMVCLSCGCTENEPCPAGCAWVRDGMCSECD